ncbi:hypothetical protein AURDEDRAFT_161764 [Auricularia subglabra TFB-10046 SS5]|nr:hypothetical protein AURDEDRAFT_161764 [Auricularia subglabra TFB-10046 SS5]
MSASAASVHVMSMLQAGQQNNRVPALALPPELLIMCCLHLSLLGRYHISQVCSFWRRTVLGFHRLWNMIDKMPDGLFSNVFETVLSRSGDLPLDISVVVCNSRMLWALSDGLKDHAARVRSLHIAADRVWYPRYSRPGPLFPFDMPNLSALHLARTHTLGRSIERPSMEYALPAFASLLQNAPTLRHFVATEMMLPVTDDNPTFPRITTVTVNRHLISERRFSSVFPALEQLNLVDVLGHSVPPYIADHKTLREVSIAFKRYWPDTATHILREYGYPFIVPGMTLRLCAGGARGPMSFAFIATWSTPAVSLTVRRNGDFMVRLHNGIDYANINVVESPMGAAHYFLHVEGTCAKLEYLSLPLYHDLITVNTFSNPPTEERMLISSDLALDRLKTLRIHVGQAGTRCLFEATGRLLSPVLSRVEVTRDPAHAGAVDNVRARELRSFVRHNIDIPDTRRHELELFVDTRGGVSLDVTNDDAAEAFRGCVGRLLFSGASSP